MNSFNRLFIYFMQLIHKHSPSFGENKGFESCIRQSRLGCNYKDSITLMVQIQQKFIFCSCSKEIFVVHSSFEFRDSQGCVYLCLLCVPFVCEQCSSVLGCIIGIEKSSLGRTEEILHPQIVYSTRKTDNKQRQN